MPEKKEYNGYTNYETWLCALWLDNDQGQQEMMSEKAEELVEECREESKENGTYGKEPLSEGRYEKLLSDMGEFIEQLVDDWRELYALPEASFFTDLVNAGLREVDYRDIAQSQLADAMNDIEVQK